MNLVSLSEETSRSNLDQNSSGNVEKIAKSPQSAISCEIKLR